MATSRAAEVAPVTLETSLQSGETDVQSLLITNTSGASVTFDISATWLGVSAELPLSAEPKTGEIGPGGQAEVDIRFTSIGSPSGDLLLRVATSDPATPVIHVPVSHSVLAAPFLQLPDDPREIESSASFSGAGATTTHSLPTGVPVGQAFLVHRLSGDFGEPGEVATVDVEGTALGPFGEAPGACVNVDGVSDLSPTEASLLAIDGVVNASVTNAGSVDDGCPENLHRLTWSYAPEREELDFGDLIGVTSRTRSFTIRNSGATDLNVSSITVDDSQFDVTPGATVVSPGSLVTVSVTVTPTVDDAPLATLTIESDDPWRPSATLQLVTTLTCLDADGDGFTNCDGDCDDANEFCTLDCTDSDADGYCVGNDCDESESFCNAACDDVDENGTFDCAQADIQVATAWAVDSSSRPFLAPGPAATSHNLLLADTPVAGGTFLLTVTGSFPLSEQTVRLAADGHTIGTAYPSPLDCESSTTFFPIAEAMTAEITANGAVHAVATNNWWVATPCPQNRHRVELRYPTKTDLDFPETGIGLETPLTVTLANRGIQDLEITSIVSDSSAFVVGSFDSTVAPGVFGSAVVTFRPLTAGPSTGTLTILSNDPDSPSVQVPLFGNGIVCEDGDGDGFENCEGDCDDTEPLASPGGVEVCTDSIDNDCNGAADLSDSRCAALSVDSVFFTSPTQLAWTPASGSAGYAVYRGGGATSSDPFYNHGCTITVPGGVETAGVGSSIPAERFFYFLVTGLQDDELGFTTGSLGLDSTGTPRPDSSPACSAP